MSLEEAVVTVQETVRPLVKDTKGQKARSGAPRPGLKVARCLYTEDYLREVSLTSIVKKIVAINVGILNAFDEELL